MNVTVRIGHYPACEGYVQPGTGRRTNKRPCLTCCIDRKRRHSKSSPRMRLSSRPNDDRIIHSRSADRDILANPLRYRCERPIRVSLSDNNSKLRDSIINLDPCFDPLPRSVHQHDSCLIIKLRKRLQLKRYFHGRILFPPCEQRMSAVALKPV